MLEHLRLKNVGPAPEMQLDLAPRLNLITGDNGLGKTLLLDVVWYLFTKTWPISWPGRGVVPTAADAEISWRLGGAAAFPPTMAKYDHAASRWDREEPYGSASERDAALKASTLVVYARVDGGFSVRDPLRVGQPFRLPFGQPALGTSSCFQFDPVQVWDGLDIERSETTTRVCEGLVRDWRNWATDPSDASFAHFADVVAAISPGESLVPLRTWRRVFADDVRDIPLLRTPAGDIAIAHAPASMKRLLGLAYILVWAWREHQASAALKRLSPVGSLVLLFDEIESHLHPQWQRRIAPALLALSTTFAPKLNMQSIVTTHSPLVLASIEPGFDVEQDKVFHLALEAGAVHLHEEPFTKQGDVDNWLVSESFGLRQARSLEAERAIEAAEALMRGEVSALPSGLATKEAIHAELLRVLAAHDEFWPRWIVSVVDGGGA